MKHNLFRFSRPALLFVVLASFAACSGGFIDPGHSDPGVAFSAGSSGMEVSLPKPTKLDSSASYEEAMDKLDEIIDYCDATGNQGGVYAAETIKASMPMVQTTWSSSKMAMIDSINSLIDGL